MGISSQRLRRIGEQRDSRVCLKKEQKVKIGKRDAVAQLGLTRLIDWLIDWLLAGLIDATRIRAVWQYAGKRWARWTVRIMATLLLM